jgi:hypothetical protein
MDSDEEAVDVNGDRVYVGMKVRVLKMSKDVLKELSEDDVKAIHSMEGQVFEVEEIDEWGGAWVEKKWVDASGEEMSHALGLGPNQMEIVD